ncbi:MAG: hypothetical protein OEV66_12805 [Spirochaetia bacterium]|nr:hypothetical protein [Spirochaetia bacterium]
MDKAIFIPLIIWAILTIVFALKSAMSQAARGLSVLVIVVYGFIFKDDIAHLIHLKPVPYMLLIKNTVEYAFISLAILWPAALIFSQYMSESEASNIIVRLAIFSGLVCAGFLYFS